MMRWKDIKALSEEAHGQYTMPDGFTVKVDRKAKVDDQADLQAGVSILGRSVVGPACRIGSGASVEDSELDHHATVCAGTRLVKSAVGIGAVIGGSGSIEGSTIEPGVRLGAHATMIATTLESGAEIGEHFTGQEGSRVRLRAYLQDHVTLEPGAAAGIRATLLEHVRIKTGAPVWDGVKLFRGEIVFADGHTETADWKTLQDGGNGK